VPVLSDALARSDFIDAYGDYVVFCLEHGLEPLRPALVGDMIDFEL